MLEAQSHRTLQPMAAEVPAVIRALEKINAGN
jgi:hypothetical protein